MYFLASDLILFFVFWTPFFLLFKIHFFSSAFLFGVVLGDRISEPFIVSICVVNLFCFAGVEWAYPLSLGSDSPFLYLAEIFLCGSVHVHKSLVRLVPSSGFHFCDCFFVSFFVSIIFCVL